MRYVLIALAFLLSGCSAGSDLDSELAARDARIGELTEANAELERRVSKLELKSAALTATAVSAIERKSPAPVGARPIPDFDRDRLESRVTDLERDAGKMPPP